METSSISTNISGATLKLFADSITLNKELLLKDIWETYLKDHIDFNTFKDEMMPKIKKKEIKTSKKLEVNKSLCRARIWNSLTKEYTQCKFKCKDSGYCDKHNEKRNYGDFY